MEFKYISRGISDSLRLAENIESEKFPNMVICLNGDLGTGKTLFTKGFAMALSINENITSPTFTIVKEYETGELPLYHMDVYRLEETDSEFGIEEYYNKGGVTIIEWAELVNKRLPEERLDIEIIAIEEEKRVFILKPYGKIYEDLCETVI